MTQKIVHYMKDDLYGTGEFSVFTEKHIRISHIKIHHTITTDYHRKKYVDFILYNYIPYGLKIDTDPKLHKTQFWFMTKNNEIREDETLKRIRP